MNIPVRVIIKANVSVTWRCIFGACVREKKQKLSSFKRVFPKNNIPRPFYFLTLYILVGGCCGETLGLKAIIWNVVYSVCLLVCSVTCAFGVANSDWVSNSAVSFQLSVSFFSFILLEQLAS